MKDLLHEKLKEYSSAKDIFSYINNLVAVFFCEDGKSHQFLEISIYKNKGLISLECLLIALIIIIKVMIGL